MTVFKCMGDNCEECPFDDCRRPESKVEDGEVTIRERDVMAQSRYKRKVYQIDLQGNRVAEFESPYLAHLETGIAASEIYRALSGKRDVVKGYRWRYA